MQRARVVRQLLDWIETERMEDSIRCARMHAGTLARGHAMTHGMLAYLDVGEHGPQLGDLSHEDLVLQTLQLGLPLHGLHRLRHDVEPAAVVAHRLVEHAVGCGHGLVHAASDRPNLLPSRTHARAEGRIGCVHRRLDGTLRVGIAGDGLRTAPLRHLRAELLGLTESCLGYDSRVD